MPAGILNDDHMMYVGKVPWHGLGTELPGLATASEALKAAKLDWLVAKEPVITAGGEVLEGSFINVRQDTGRPLGVVGGKYQTTQNHEAFKFFDAVTQDPGGPKYVTAGSLWSGGRVWMLAKLPDFIEVVKTDVIEEYILLSITHDGFGRNEMLYTAVRVVCQNTLGLALNQRSDSQKAATFKFRHLGSVMDRVSEAQDILGIARQNHASLFNTIELLSTKYPNDQQIQAVLDQLYGSYIPGKRTSQSESVQSKVRELMEKGAGQDIKGVHGTYWGLYNAITEFEDHHKSSKARVYDRDESRLESIWFGNGMKQKSSALDLIMDLAIKS